MIDLDLQKDSLMEKYSRLVIGWEILMVRQTD